MRKHKMVHDWSNNHVYLNLKDEHVRVDLQSGKAHPLAHGYFRADSDTTVFTESDLTTSRKLLQDMQEGDGSKV